MIFGRSQEACDDWVAHEVMKSGNELPLGTHAHAG